MASHGRDIGEDGGNVESGVLRVRLQHEVELASVPALESLFEPQPIQDFRGNGLGDAISLPPLAEPDAEQRQNEILRGRGRRRNVESIRAVYERFSEGDFRASVDLLDPHVVPGDLGSGAIAPRIPTG